MEGALTTWGVGTLLLGDPDSKVFAGANGVGDVTGGVTCRMESLANEVGHEEDAAMVNLVGSIVDPGGGTSAAEDVLGDAEEVRGGVGGKRTGC